MEQTSTNFPERLKTVIKREHEFLRKGEPFNESINAVSRITGIDVEDIQAYLQGEREPLLEHLVLISKRFVVSIDYLLGLVDEQTEKATRKFKLFNDDSKDIALAEILKIERDENEMYRMIGAKITAASKTGKIVDINSYRNRGDNMTD